MNPPSPITKQLQYGTPMGTAGRMGTKYEKGTQAEPAPHAQKDIRKRPPAATQWAAAMQTSIGREHDGALQQSN